MMKRTVLLAVVAGSLTLPSAPVSAADQQQDRDQVQEKKQDQIYGSQLMTRQERVEFRAKMRAAKTAEEREQIRLQHHERMKERAKAKGITLPDAPPAMGGGMGTGGGMGPGGMGSGGGMGTGGMGPGGGRK
ncbi:MAG: hypothetical protein ACYDG4_02865 [Desulfuromonadaceae bacterium]